MPSVGYRVTIDGEDVPYVSLSYELTPLDAGQAPTFRISLPNVHGYQARRYYGGRMVRIYRTGLGEDLRFWGRIENVKVHQEDGNNTVELIGPHYWYDKLMTKYCHHYRVNNGDYAPVINPWQFGRYVDGSDVLEDGLRPDEILRQLIGTRFYWQEFFHNLDAFDTAPESAGSNLLKTRDVLIKAKTDGTGDGQLELRPTLTGYSAQGIATSVVLQNGPDIVSKMGDVESVQATIIGTGGLSAVDIDNQNVTPTEVDGFKMNGDGNTIYTQTFTVAERLIITPFVTNLSMWLRKVGTPIGNVVFRVSDVHGIGGVTNQFPVRELKTTYTNVAIILPEVTLEPGTTYYLSVEHAGDAANYIEISKGPSYVSGEVLRGYDTVETGDFNFRLNLSRQHLPTGTSVDIAFSRDGGETFSSYQTFVQLPETTNKYRTAEYAFSGNETVKNQLVYRIRLTGNEGVVAQDVTNLSGAAPTNGHAISSLRTKVLQSFTVPANSYVASGNNLQLHLRKVGAVEGEYLVRLSSEKGTSGILARGHTNDLTGTYEVKSFNLPGNTIVSGKTYYISVEYAGGDASNYIAWGFGPAFAGGDSELYAGGTWTADSNDMSFKLFLVKPSTSSPRVDYVKLDAKTKSDTGLVEGEIDTYVPPKDSDGKSIGVAEVAIGVLGETRASALEMVRKLTVASELASTSPYWDLKIHHDGRVDFKEVIGTGIMLPDSPTGKLGKGNANTFIIDRDVDAKIGNVIIAKGVGTEPWALTIQGEHLRNEDSIALYGERLLTYTDTSITDISTLDNKARAALRYYSSERESITIRGKDYFGVLEIGDFVYLDNEVVDTTDRFRIMQLTVEYEPDTGSETFEATLQNKPVGFANILDALAKDIDNQNNTQQGQVVAATSSGLSVRMGKDQNGFTQAAEHEIVITDPASVKRIFLNLKTESFDAYATASEQASIDSATAQAAASGIASLTSGSVATGNVLVNSVYSKLVALPTDGGPGGYIISAGVDMLSGDTGDVEFQINYGTRMFHVAGKSGSAAGSIILPGSATGNVELIIVSRVEGGSTLYTNYELRWTIQGIASHEHPLTIPAHSHPMQHGIYKLRDDTGVIYPSKLALYVGETNFNDNPKFPFEALTEFGVETASVSVQGVDISNAMDRNGNYIFREGSTQSAPGKFKEGSFKVYILPIEDTTRNPRRLGKVVINSVIERQRMGQE